MLYKVTSNKVGVKPLVKKIWKDGKPDLLELKNFKFSNAQLGIIDTRAIQFQPEICYKSIKYRRQAKYDTIIFNPHDI